MLDKSLEQRLAEVTAERDELRQQLASVTEDNAFNELSLRVARKRLAYVKSAATARLRKVCERLSDYDGRQVPGVLAVSIVDNCEKTLAAINAKAG